MNKKQDNTSTFFKECIAQALIILLQEKELSNISITELTRIAGVSRMAFYRNFSSKEDVLYSYFDIILQRYDETEKDFPHGTYYDMEHLIHYFSYVLKYKDFLYAITMHSYGYIFSESMTNYIIKKWLTDKDDRGQLYKLYAFAGSLYNLYVGWVNNNFQESPEEMAQIFSSFYDRS